MAHLGTLAGNLSTKISYVNVTRVVYVDRHSPTPDAILRPRTKEAGVLARRP